jgi:small subunit ribosomal protein S7
MPRRREVPIRKIAPDPVHGDLLVAKFTNVLMLNGKKSIAEGIFYGALNVVADRTQEDPVRVFHAAIEACEPVVEVKSRRVGGSTYQVPIEVRGSRQTALAMRWLIRFARQRSGKSMKEKLANEIIEAAHKRGGAVKKREDVHRMAEANKAFSHYRW